jgi:hypothetical protein
MLPGQLFKRREKKRRLEEEVKRRQEDNKFKEVKNQDWRKNEKAPRNTRTEEYMNRLKVFDKMKPKSFYVFLFII